MLADYLGNYLDGISVKLHDKHDFQCQSRSLRSPPPNRLDRRKDQSPMAFSLEIHPQSYSIIIDCRGTVYSDGDVLEQFTV